MRTSSPGHETRTRPFLPDRLRNYILKPCLIIRTLHHGRYRASDDERTLCAIITRGTLNTVTRADVKRGSTCYRTFACAGFFFFSATCSVTVGTSSSLIPFPGWAEIRLLTHAFSTHSSHERSVSVIWIHEWTLKNATKGRTIVRRATALWLITSPENRAKSTLRLVTRAITWVMKSLRLNNCYLAL